MQRSEKRLQRKLRLENIGKLKIREKRIDNGEYRKQNREFREN